jgi:hypothetical protein
VAKAAPDPPMAGRSVLGREPRTAGLRIRARCAGCRCPRRGHFVNRKPFDTSDLLAAVESLLVKQRSIDR